MIRYVIACVVAAASGPVWGDDAVRLERLNTAYAAWLDAQGITGVLAAGPTQGDIVAFGHGADASRPVELASVSKSITAVCAMQLVHQGTLSWGDFFADVVGRGPDIPLSMLVTHASGLQQDSTQADMGDHVNKPGPHRSGAVLDAVIARDGPAGNFGAFVYNNENYALVALMIEAATGRDYRSVCQELALDPVGVTGEPSPQLGIALPWGAWTLPVADYAAFHAHWFGRDHAPMTLPQADAGQGISYGMGTFFRALDRGNTYWHFGALCIGDEMTIGSYAVTWFAEWTVVAAYDGCVDWDAMFALDQAMARAALAPLE